MSVAAGGILSVQFAGFIHDSEILKSSNQLELTRTEFGKVTACTLKKATTDRECQA
jgi:hypothetical protein